MARSLDYKLYELHHESKKTGQMADDYSITSFQKWLAIATTNNLRVVVDFHTREVFSIFEGRNDGAATDLTQSALSNMPFYIPKNSPSLTHRRIKGAVRLCRPANRQNKIERPLRALRAICRTVDGQHKNTTPPQGPFHSPLYLLLRPARRMPLRSRSCMRG